ncbi:hypothetical protein NPIL_282551 [Nephila pilipes]|uniref:Secreted protein n=1 Tax=Nephila pilipes TaxID=299642 RepID=A0A8X6T6Q8_NEPPI|nr:hypothetical protein NPIL_282551 [Nephila pilipes]
MHISFFQNFVMFRLFVVLSLCTFAVSSGGPAESRWTSYVVPDRRSGPTSATCRRRGNIRSRQSVARRARDGRRPRTKTKDFHINDIYVVNKLIM